MALQPTASQRDIKKVSCLLNHKRQDTRMQLAYSLTPTSGSLRCNISPNSRKRILEAVPACGVYTSTMPDDVSQLYTNTQLIFPARDLIEAITRDAFLLNSHGISLSVIGLCTTVSTSLKCSLPLVTIIHLSFRCTSSATWFRGVH